MGTANIDPIFFGVSGIRDPEDAISAVSDTGLKTIAEAVNSNFRDIQLLLALPLIATFGGVFAGRQTFLYVKAATNLLSEEGINPLLPENSDLIRAEANRLILHPDELGEVFAETKSKLGTLSEAASMKSTLRNLMSLSLSAAWTAFECAATDIWTYSINTRPQQLGNRAIDHVKGVNGVHGISFKLLSKHRFDISTCLGNVMAAQFSFSSLSGIAHAYRAAFGKCSEVAAALRCSDLQLLQAYRHVIVHKAGKVDQAFIDTTKLPFGIGEQLPMEGEIVRKCINSALDATIVLLKFADPSPQKDPISPAKEHGTS